MSTLQIWVAIRDALTIAIDGHSDRLTDANAQLLRSLTEAEQRMRLLTLDLANAHLENARLRSDVKALHAQTRMKQRQFARRRISPKMQKAR